MDRKALAVRIVLLATLMALAAPIWAQPDCLDYSGTYPLLADRPLYETGGVHRQGDRAYLIRWEHDAFTLEIADLADPVKLRTLGTVILPQRAVIEFVDSRSAYLRIEARLLRIDVSDPQRPVIDAITEDIFLPGRFRVDGTLMYTLGSGDVLRIYDVSDFTHPAELGSVPLPGSSNRQLFAWRGNLVVASAAHILGVDVGDPAAPSVVWQHTTDAGTFLEAHLAGDHLYVGTEPLTIFQLVPPFELTEVGSYDAASFRYARLDVADDRLVCSLHCGDVHVADIGIPHQPIPVATLNHGTAVEAWPVGDLLLIDARHQRLQVTDPLQWTTVDSQVGTGQLTTRLFNLQSNDRAVFGYNSGWGTPGFRSLEVAADGSVREWDSMDIACRGFDLEGDLVATTDGGDLLLVDVSNPADLRERSRIDLPIPVWHPVLAEGFVACLSRTAYDNNLVQLNLIDARDPAAPRYVHSTVPYSHRITFITARDDLVFAAVQKPGLWIFRRETGLGDDPADPGLERIGKLRLTGHPIIQSIVMDGALVYLSSFHEVHIVDVSEPEHPRLLSTFANPTGRFMGQGPVVLGDLLLTAGQEQVLIVDAHDPSEPRVAGRIDHDDYITGILATDDLLLTIDGSGRALTHLLPCTGATAGDEGSLTDISGTDHPVSPGRGLGRIYPLPANPRVTIELDLAAPTSGHIDIFDLRGRRVARVADGLLPAFGSVRWDGRDDAGRDVATGVYFVRLVGREIVDTRRVVLIR